jgi:hypothetical protein
MPPLVRFEHLGEEGGNLWSFVDEGPYVAFWFGQGEGLSQRTYGPRFLASFPQSQRLERKDLYLTAAPSATSAASRSRSSSLSVWSGLSSASSTRARTRCSRSWR